MEGNCDEVKQKQMCLLICYSLQNVSEVRNNIFNSHKSNFYHCYFVYMFLSSAGNVLRVCSFCFTVACQSSTKWCLSWNNAPFPHTYMHAHMKTKCTHKHKCLHAPTYNELGLLSEIVDLT